MYSEKSKAKEGDTSTTAASRSGEEITIQRCLAVGAVDDPLEKEADAMANRVMRMPEPAIQRKCAHCEEEERINRKPLESKITPFIQAKGANVGVASNTVTRQIQATRGRGNPMPDTTRSFMESRFGTDFSGVRLHSGEYAVQLSKELNAQAFTVGSDIYFNASRYSPETLEGKHLLAHELTHTVQQNHSLLKSIQKQGNQTELPIGFSCPVGQSSAEESMFVLFAHISSNLSPLEAQTIRSIIDGWWSSGANSFIRLDGYASEEGSQQLNWNLSCARVQTVYNALQQPTPLNGGIPASYLRMFANGEATSFGSRPANRRVSVSIQFPVAPAPSPQPTPTPTPPSNTGPLSSRSDRRTEYEVERDRRRRTPEGGRDRSRATGGDLDSDWAGRAILGRYLSGGGEWHINNDSNWSRYMMADESLKQQLQDRLIRLAQANSASTFGVNESFPAELANGEGIIGYQYLHGTNATVGGFQIRGAATNSPDGAGGRTINFISLMFTWNDMIDPNPQYGTDTIKSIFAEIITLGQADAYIIHITWLSNPSVTLDNSGNVVRASGYPFD